jgi:glycopeptide antibiotics resistance protein
MITFVIAEIGRNFYRPYIYQNKINDFGFADSIGNSLGTIAIIFFVFSLVMREGFRKEPYFILAIVGWLLLYEAAQCLLPGYYFDWKDVKATIVAGVLSYLIYILVNRNETKINKKKKI